MALTYPQNGDLTKSLKSGRKKCPRVPVWVRGGGVIAIWAMPTWRWWQIERCFPKGHPCRSKKSEDFWCIEWMSARPVLFFYEGCRLNRIFTFPFTEIDFGWNQMIFQIKIKNKLESALENTLGGQGHDQTGFNTKDEILKLTICLYLETFWSTSFFGWCY